MLKVVHKHGPCSPLTPGQKPNHAELLNQDQARVNWLHRRISTSSNQNSSTRASLAANIPASSGGSIGTGNYVVNVGFGTPTKEFTVIFDTGSDLTWIQCSPCRSCYPQQQKLFDPSQSSTYSNIPCNSPKCSQLDSSSCSASRCKYEVHYGDQSQSEGFFGSDTLTLTPSDVLQNFLFGCGDQSNGLFGRAAGLIGLGRQPVSLVSQSKSTYGGVFSYCLPSTSSSQGYLKLGGGAPSNVQFTPMRTSPSQPSFYFLDLVAIEVGGKQLPISPTVFSNAGTILDSGTAITRLPPSAYDALRSRFQQLMTKYKRAQALTILDTCYDFTGYSTVSVPTVALVFGSGATLYVDFTGILYVSSVSQACLAFAGNGDASDVGIIGNVQQKRFDVVYDITNSRIGFGANGCS